MKKKLVIGLFMIFMFVGFASAFMTTVQIKTLPSHDVFITPIRTGSSYEALIQPMVFLSDGYGDVEAIFEVDTNNFDLAVLIKNGDQRIHYEKFTEAYVSGSLINLTVAPEGAELFYRPEVAQQEIVEFMVEGEIVEEALIEEVVAPKGIPSSIEAEGKEVGGDKSGFLSGNTIVDFNKPFVRVVGYSLVAIIILVIIFLVLKMRKKGKIKRKNLGYKDKKEENKENKEKKEKEEKKEEDNLNRAEKDLKAAQERINKFKNNDKLLEAKKKLIEAEKELLRLRGVTPDNISMKERLKEEMEKKE